jgi:hypothetical protein
VLPEKPHDTPSEVSGQVAQGTCCTCRGAWFSVSFTGSPPARPERCPFCGFLWLTWTIEGEAGGGHGPRSAAGGARGAPNDGNKERE